MVHVDISESTKEPGREGFFCTTDTDLAAALKTAGVQLKDISTRTERVKNRSYKRTEFIFKAEGTKEVILKYANNNLMLDAKTLMQERDALKRYRFNRGAK